MQIKYTLLVVSILLFFGANAQSDTGHSTPYTFVERMPEAGYDYQDYLNKHIVYPDEARSKNIQGKSIIRFVVNEDGSISDCNVVRKAGYGMDEEALRVVRSFPAWKPGMQNGKAVKVYFAIPVIFNLADVSVEKKDAMLIVTDQMPSPGYNLVEYIAANVQYPRTARKKGKQGVVRTRFVVNEDGSISNCEIVDSVSQELDEEAMRVVKSMPKWKPGTLDGKAAKISVVLPITFETNTDHSIGTSTNHSIISKNRPMRSENTDHRLPVGRVK